VASVQEYAAQAASQPAPRPVQPASRAGLFAEPPRPVSTGAPAQPAPEPARPSLFSTVTGAFRRRQHAPATHAEPAPVRAEPVMQEPRPEPPRASVRQTAGDEVAGLDIPAFLRRQSS
jgi:cell division protein FtsZ